MDAKYFIPGFISSTLEFFADQSYKEEEGDEKIPWDVRASGYLGNLLLHKDQGVLSLLEYNWQKRGIIYFN